MPLSAIHQSDQLVGRAARTLLEKGLVNTGSIRIDGQDRRRARCVLKRKPSGAAANLKDTLVLEAHEALDQPRFEFLPRICRELGGGHRGIVSQALGDDGRGRPTGGAS
jgi:hypothetical protein